MVFETPPKDFKPFKIVMKEFPYYPHHQVFYVTLKPKSIRNSVWVSWYDEEIELRRVMYDLDDVERLLASGQWRKLD